MKPAPGIKIGSYESVICQYADDTTLTLGDKTSMKNTIQLINKVPSGIRSYPEYSKEYRYIAWAIEEWPQVM